MSADQATQEYYSLSEVKLLMERSGTSMSTFYRLAAQQGIEKLLSHDQQRGASYNKKQVDKLIEQRSQKTYRRKSRQNSTTTKYQQADSNTQVNELQGATDWIQQEDLLNVFALDYELYGDATVPPQITRYWWQKNPTACRILFNKNNRKDIWGALTILPMEEQTIYDILSGKLEEMDIRPEHILSYEPGKTYIAYVASIAIRPERRGNFVELLRSVMNFWCEQYPTIRITKLYAYALGGEESDGMRLISKLCFAPRYDIGDGENSWELRLDHYNPSPIIQAYQRCLRQKATAQRYQDSEKLILKFSHVKPKERSSSHFRPVQSKDDIAAMVDMAEQVFGASGVPVDELTNLWHTWWRKNAEIFYVLEIDNIIIGFVSILPLNKMRIDRILREEEQPKDITNKNIEAFLTGVPVDLYLHVLTTQPRLSNQDKRTYGMRLLQGLIDVFAGWGKRGINIRKIYARSRMDDGINLSQQIGFQEIAPPPGINKRHFELDITHRTDNPFLKAYWQAFDEYQSKQ
jgi:hypothetical protein